jgi:hypothetical protein
MPLKSGPSLYAACGVITFVIFLSWRNLQEVDSTRTKWSAPKIPSSVEPHIGCNYVSAGWGKKEIDTTSEIGRASNASLGVCSLSLFIHSPVYSALSDFVAISSRSSSFWD